MDSPNSAGRVTLNAEGKQYTALYQLRRGVITVTSGSASRLIRLGEEVSVPESVARTILRMMVREHCQLAELPRRPRDHYMGAKALRGRETALACFDRTMIVGTRYARH